MSAAPDLLALYQQVVAHETLWESRDALLNGLLGLLDSNSAPDVAAALRAEVRHPHDPNRRIPWIRLLGDALTQNTSHVAVDPRHPGFELACRLLTEAPELDKAAHIAMLEGRVADHAAALDKLAAAHAALTTDHVAALGALQAHANRLAAQEASLVASTEKARAHADHIEALSAHLAARDAKIEALSAQLETAKAEIFDAGTVTGNGGGDRHDIAESGQKKAAPSEGS